MPALPQPTLSELSPYLISARAIERQDKPTRLPTGVPGLDEPLGGGLLRGDINEVCGPRSSGRTVLALRLLAEALAHGHASALLDVGGGLDARAARSAGIPLQRLLWVRCDARQLPRAAELVLEAGGFGLVVLDYGDTRPLRVPDAAWMRLQRLAARHDTALLISTPWRTAGARGGCVVALEAGRPRFIEAHAHAPALLELAGHARIERVPGHAMPGPGTLAFAAARNTTVRG